MKKYAAILVSLIFFVPAFTSLASINNQARSEVTPLIASNKVLVKLRPALEVTADAESIADQILPARSKTSELLQAGAGGALLLIELDDRASVQDSLQRLNEDPRVEYAEPDYLLLPANTFPNDTYFTEQWSLLNDGRGLSGKVGADIGATQAWDLTTGSDDVVVAIIDTGVDLSHPDLAPNAWVNRREIADNGIDDDHNGFVDDINGWNFKRNNNRTFEDPRDDFHGTHVAGIVGAKGNNGEGVSGVAWRVKLMALKFLGLDGGNTSGAVKAINYVIAQRKSGVNLRVINASWGGPGASVTLRNAIIAAGEAGILFVAAAGNGGDSGVGYSIDDMPEYPASWGLDLSSVISVAALDSADNLASFSNYGRKSVCVGAPGVKIISTVPGAGYSYASGTSMATPHVSGMAALLWSREASLTPSRVRERIVSTGEPVLALASRAINPARVNAFNASSNIVPAAGRVGINAVKANKKALTVDGLGFIGGSSVVEINGAAQARTRYDSEYSLANQTLTRLTVKLGKSGMKSAIPPGVPVSITVYNPATGERSAPFSFVRN